MSNNGPLMDCSRTSSFQLKSMLHHTTAKCSTTSGQEHPLGSCVVQNASAAGLWQAICLVLVDRDSTQCHASDSTA